MRLPMAILITLLCMALSGCASMDSGKRYTHEVRGEYVATVNEVAKRRGVTVLWVNPPTRQQVRDLDYSTQVTVERGP